MVFCMTDLLDASGVDGFPLGGRLACTPAASVRDRGSAAGACVPAHHLADERIRIRADVLAAGVAHVVLGIGAVLLRRRQHGRSGADEQCESNCGPREHDWSPVDWRTHPLWWALASRPLACMGTISQVSRYFGAPGIAEVRKSSSK